MDDKAQLVEVWPIYFLNDKATVTSISIKNILVFLFNVCLICLRKDGKFGIDVSFVRFGSNLRNNKYQAPS